MREAGITRADLMRRLEWTRESVDRLLRLDHASRFDQIEAAFRASADRSVDRERAQAPSGNDLTATCPDDR
jgi:antitoxin HicB